MRKELFTEKFEDQTSISSVTPLGIQAGNPKKSVDGLHNILNEGVAKTRSVSQINILHLTSVSLSQDFTHTPQIQKKLQQERKTMSITYEYTWSGMGTFGIGS